MKRYCLFFIGLFLTLCVKAQEDPILMRVRQTKVHLSEFEYAYKKHCASENALSVKDFLQHFIDYKILVEAAKEQKMDTTSQYKQSLVLLGLDVADTPSAPVVGLMNKAQKRYELFCVPIPQSAGSRFQQEALQKIDSVRIALKDGLASREVMNRFSKTGRHSLQLTNGVRKRNQTYKEVEQVVFSMKENEVSRPFLTPEGYCVVSMTDSWSGASVPERSRAKQYTSDSLLQKEYREGILVRTLLDHWEKNWDIDNLNKLFQYYSANMKSYFSTEPSFDGIVLACKSSKQLKEVKKSLKRILPSQWLSWLERHNANDENRKVLAEKGIFEQGECDAVDQLVFKQKTQVEEWDGYPYRDKIGKKQKKRQMPFPEVQEQVKADYIHGREEDLLSELRKEYQVKVDESVLRKVNKNS